jgi:hypothetical protein
MGRVEMKDRLLILIGAHTLPSVRLNPLTASCPQIQRVEGWCAQRGDIRLETEFTMTRCTNAVLSVDKPKSRH